MTSINIKSELHIISHILFKVFFVKMMVSDKFETLLVISEISDNCNMIMKVNLA